ncbi:hypothetical protein Y032_0277g1103 [Ancylostoma ceylanicum]|uniref:PWI domain-containing protein n=1 Tax=Ancylostoma ceylanicum TaxID=53326 RepID=A0A016S7U4_9BILA|nr:hypothetical protein Y032_0277g1103 [Ancylostoma ceylanicum]
MHIENVEEFTTWLIAELTPICDAEPGALAKYVLALLRKPNKSDEEMRAFSTDQLEVFLQGKALPTGRGVSHNGRAPRAVLRLCPHRTVSPGHGRELPPNSGEPRIREKDENLARGRPRRGSNPAVHLIFRICKRQH